MWQRCFTGIRATFEPSVNSESFQVYALATGGTFRPQSLQKCCPMTVAEAAARKDFLRQIELLSTEAINEAEEPVEAVELLLPSLENVQAAEPPCRNPPLIHGVVRRGHVMLLAGKGKGAKTWAAIQLAVAVAMGGDWFGYRCEKGDCLYIDPELDKKSLDNRFHDVCEA